MTNVKSIDTPYISKGICALCGEGLVVKPDSHVGRICRFCYLADGSTQMVEIVADIKKVLQKAPSYFNIKRYLKAKGAKKGRTALLRRAVRFMRHRKLIRALDRDTFVSFSDDTGIFD